MSETTIVLAVEHAVVRSGLQLLLHGEHGLRVVAEAGDADGALRLTGARRPTVLVLDLGLPGDPPAFETIRAVSEMAPDTAIVVLTAQEDPSSARAALTAGAVAYVLEEAADAELLEAVRTAARGGRHVSPRVGAALAAAGAHPVPSDDLTDREVEILRLIALGHTNAEIGGQLYLSVRTVESHRAHIQQKLRLTARSELVRYAIGRGLLSDV